MADTNKKEYASNLHPKGDLDTTVYPNVKSENIIDKDLTSYTAGKVPDSSLVSKSLDGLSENLETTKIQVATNKNNIETLQGNYTGLQYQVNTNSSDIALTKTQVETNKANIAKNTQDIENLSAVMPTDINVDSNYNLILEHDGTEITGQKKLIKLPFVYEQDKYDLKSVLFSHHDNKPIIGNLRLWESSRNNSNYESSISCSLCWTTSAGNAVPAYTVNVKSGDITIHVGKRDYSFYEIIYSPNNIPDYGEVYIRVPTKSGTFALLEDLDAKQDKRFVHTVEIHYASNGSYFCFTGTSDKNTHIDSVEKLTNVFANRDLVGVGVFGSAGLSKIHVGSSVNDTTFKKYMTNGEYINPSEETFATVFNPTGFTITDNVTAM